MTGGILVVDDEASIRRLVGAVLARGGYEVVEASDARAALALATRDPMAAIVDLGLPDKDGLELVNAFAARELPTLVLSARTDVADKVAALDLGADDYLTKPFDGDELLARLRAMLRRAGRSVDDVIAYGALTVEPAFHRARVHDRQVELTPREFALLTALVQAQGRVLTHGSLLEKVWGPAHRDDLDYLRVAIRALRRKVEAQPSRPMLIVNVAGVGYRIAEEPRIDERLLFGSQTQPSSI